jgi:hypothetical protein
MGTPDYVAPEQIAGEEVDGRADVYSLGCVLYECLVGRPPFRRDSELAVVFAHLETEPPAPSAERVDLPAALDAVIARALAKEPEERYASCRELARAALEVAVDEASRRLVDVASRAAAGRSDLSEVEAELTGKVVDLQLAREQAQALAGPHTPTRLAAEGICPFKGPWKKVIVCRLKLPFGRNGTMLPPATGKVGHTEIPGRGEIEQRPLFELAAVLVQPELRRTLEAADQELDQELPHDLETLTRGRPGSCQLAQRRPRARRAAPARGGGVLRNARRRRRMPSTRLLSERGLRWVERACARPRQR